MKLLNLLILDNHFVNSLSLQQQSDTNVGLNVKGIDQI